MYLFYIDIVLGDEKSFFFLIHGFLLKKWLKSFCFCSMTYLTLQVQRRVSAILSDISEPGSLGALTWDPGRLPF